MKIGRLFLMAACGYLLTGIPSQGAEKPAASEGASASKSPAETPAAPKPAVETVEAGDGKYHITIDTTDAPDLTEWAKSKLTPVVVAWYPKIVAMLPSEGFEAPKEFSVTFSPRYHGVAATGGTRIMCAPDWFRHNLDGEARGAVVHEMVHVVQQYGRARRTNPTASRPPGWLVEGIPDYIRWYKYEPQSHGADISPRRAAGAKYNGSYRVSANFLNWVVNTYDKKLIAELNDVLRAGKYDEAIWKEHTGKNVQQLGEEWHAGLLKPTAAVSTIDSKFAAAQASADARGASTAQSTAPAQLAADDQPAGDAAPNRLTAAQKEAGWQLLFDGKDTKGWHTFRRKDVRPGWVVKNGTLACVDPHNAGDICTDQKFGWFELQLDYNISHAGNSGIMYHVADVGGAVWQSGPEFQLEDNTAAADPVRCGWLYALYQPPVDPKTGKILDATKPVGQWNHVRLLISPEKCVHEINGVKYFEYVLNSPDFKARVAKSKFASMKDFAKYPTGYIALQGDHGQVAFRNIMVKPIEEKK